jgi:protein disulfide-isomerase-like protein
MSENFVNNFKNVENKFSKKLLDDELEKGGVVFIKWFAPWCGYCQDLAPKWEELGNYYQKNSKICIGEIDCTEEAGGDLFATENGIQGFPTLKLYKNNMKNPIDYNGNRELEDMKSFVNNNIEQSGGRKQKIKKRIKKSIKNKKGGHRKRKSKKKKNVRRYGI